MGETPVQAPLPDTGVAAPSERLATPMWTCPVCAAENPIEGDFCAVCGTPFAQLLRDTERRPNVAPRTAVSWSLVFPGLGHWRLGHGLEALLRAGLFVWVAGIAILLLFVRTAGPTAILLATFSIVTVALYVLSALEAHRMALGWPPIVPATAFLWGSAILVAISALLIGVAVATAGSGR